MIAIGSDHVGFEYKEIISNYIKELGYDSLDFGTFNTDRTDYPIFGKAVADAVASGQCDKGILICGTGIGISIVANKVKGIRAVACSDPYSAILSREHNNTNILCFGSRVIGIELAKFIVKSWLESKFESGRHQIRISMIDDIENKEE